MRTVVYDEELMFSDAVASLFERRHHEIVGRPPTRTALVELVSRADVDACLVSVGAARPNDIALIRQLREAQPAMAIVALSNAADLAALLGVLGGGADGFCLKVDGIEEIEALLRRCVAARQVPAVQSGPRVALSSSASAASRRRTPARGYSITAKEQRVLELLVEGFSTPSIAAELRVGEATVRTHLQHLFSKFGVHSRLALVAQAVRTNAVAVGHTALAS